MIIVISKDNAEPRQLPSNFALSFYRAFRAELWANGILRDPKPGDELLGIKIIGLTI